MLMRQGADRRTAEDIAQETLSAVCRQPRAVAGDRGKACAFIYAVARDLRIDRLTHQGAWQRAYGESEATDRSAAPPDGAAFAERDRDAIEAALAALPRQQAQIMQMSFIDGLAAGEIAARLGLPAETVRLQMRHAFEALRCAAGYSS